MGNTIFFGTLKFLFNWNNKLYGTYFTTIRVNSDKYKVNSSFNVFVSNSEIIPFNVVCVRKYVYSFNDIPDVFINIDMGMERKEALKWFKKLYGEKYESYQYCVLLFKRL